jgi:hypothetical protein
MDGGTSDGLMAWLIDAAAATALATAAGVCGYWLSGANVGMAAATAALIAGLWSLRQIQPEPARFKVPSLALVGWDVISPGQAEDEDCLLLTELADPCAPAVPLPENVTILRPALPTPGELQRRIEKHFGEVAARNASDPKPPDQIIPLAADASAALRSALSDLRRSVR